MRFNLENGETAPWNIPVETMYIPDVVGDALLLCRVVSDYPVPYPDDDEMSQALCRTPRWNTPWPTRDGRGAADLLYPPL